ncbi:hypothetical protein ACFFLM_21335 [Deinococcus oregonensis]|uniref:Transglycosylase SLT domain-containing protein n=1 Tax=Deinococcus oregonensis TaxID=1805970 RepID=A0ABV6B423_9DEIO
MSSNVSSKHLMLAGIGVGLAAGALAAAQGSKRPAVTTPSPTKPTGSGGTATVPSVPPKVTTPSTATPRPAPTPPTPVITIPKPTGPTGPQPTEKGVPAGPSWGNQPNVNAPNGLEAKAAKVERFIKAQNPAAWLSPIALPMFAKIVCIVAEEEKYPLDLLLGHMWAENALSGSMVPTRLSGAIGPLQVTAITCADVGMSYPPRDQKEAIRAGIRYMRKANSYGAVTITDALRVYGLGPTGWRNFKREGCDGAPCSRSQSVWKHECGCSGPSQRYTHKVNGMTLKAAAAGLHDRDWRAWAVKL